MWCYATDRITGPATSHDIATSAFVVARATIAIVLLAATPVGAPAALDFWPWKAGSFTLDGTASGWRYDGHGAASFGASSRLLYDYLEPQRSEILDYLFMPKVGASLHHLKIEIGGDSQTAYGTEPSHMHHRGEVSCNRGFEFWLLSEARKRNPAIVAYALVWALPGWIGELAGHEGFYGQDGIDYLLAWLGCARERGLWPIQYLGHRSSRPWGQPAWTVKLRDAMDDFGFNETALVLPDGDYDPGILAAAASNATFALALATGGGGVGLHYPCYSPYPEVHLAGFGYWSTEDAGVFGDWPGASCLGRLINQNFVLQNMTATIARSLLFSTYPGLSNGSKGDGLIDAIAPWSGRYTIRETLWTLAHTTQFTEIGWRILNVYGLGGQVRTGSVGNAAEYNEAAGLANGQTGSSGILDRGGSFVTYASPKSDHFTLVVEKLMGQCSRCATAVTDMEPLTFTLTGGLDVISERLGFWMSNETHRFVQLPDLTVDNATKSFSFTARPDSIYTVSSVRGQARGLSLTNESAADLTRWPVEDFRLFGEGACRASSCSCVPYWRSVSSGLWMARELCASDAECIGFSPSDRPGRKDVTLFYSAPGAGRNSNTCGVFTIDFSSTSCEGSYKCHIKAAPSNCTVLQVRTVDGVSRFFTTSSCSDCATGVTENVTRKVRQFRRGQLIWEGGILLLQSDGGILREGLRIENSIQDSWLSGDLIEFTGSMAFCGKADIFYRVSFVNDTHTLYDFQEETVLNGQENIFRVGTTYTFVPDDTLAAHPLLILSDSQLGNWTMVQPLFTLGTSVADWKPAESGTVFFFSHISRELDNASNTFQVVETRLLVDLTGDCEGRSVMPMTVGTNFFSDARGLTVPVDLPTMFVGSTLVQMAREKQGPFGFKVVRNSTVFVMLGCRADPTGSWYQYYVEPSIADLMAQGFVSTGVGISLTWELCNTAFYHLGLQGVYQKFVEAGTVVDITIRRNANHAVFVKPQDFAPIPTPIPTREPEPPSFVGTARVLAPAPQPGHRVARGEPFPLPYYDDFDSYAVDDLAKYFADYGGSWQVTADPVTPGGNLVIRQWAVQRPGVNQWATDADPISFIAPGTSDVIVSASVYLPASGARLPPQTSGYHRQAPSDVQSPWSGRCLGTQSGGAWPGVPIEQQDCSGDSNKHFRFDASSGLFAGGKPYRCITARICPALTISDLCLQECGDVHHPFNGNQSWLWGEDGSIRLRMEPHLCVTAFGKATRSPLRLLPCMSEMPSDMQRWIATGTNFAMHGGVCARLAGPAFGTPGRQGSRRGYCLTVGVDTAGRGMWQLEVNGSVALAQGRMLALLDTWHGLTLELKGTEVKAVVDGVVKGFVRDGSYAVGMVAVSSSWSEVYFDDLAIEPTSDETEFEVV